MKKCVKKVFHIEIVENVENSAKIYVENCDSLWISKSYQHRFPHFQHSACGEPQKSGFCAKCTRLPKKGYN